MCLFLDAGPLYFVRPVWAAMPHPLRNECAPHRSWRAGPWSGIATGSQQAPCQASPTPPKKCTRFTPSPKKSVCHLFPRATSAKEKKQVRDFCLFLHSAYAFLPLNPPSTRALLLLCPQRRLMDQADNVVSSGAVIGKGLLRILQSSQGSTHSEIFEEAAGDEVLARLARLLQQDMALPPGTRGGRTVADDVIQEVARARHEQYSTRRAAGAAYVLTLDNARKIANTLLRWRCGLPTLLMGEAGCGKTEQVRYMAHLLGWHFLLTKLNGGSTPGDIAALCREANARCACAGRGTRVVLFWDELNACMHMGLFEELLLNRRFLDVDGRTWRSLHDNVYQVWGAGEGSGALEVKGQTNREGEKDIWWTARTARGETGHLGRTETQRGRLWTACGQRCVDSKNSQTTAATTSTSPIRQLLGAADAQTAHPATSSTAPTHQPLGSANAETTPAGAPAAAADRTQRPDATCEGKNG